MGADDEYEDDDDSVAAAAVKGRQRVNWGNRLSVPAGGGGGRGGRSRSPEEEEEGSSTPYHIIEILINSGGDNLPGVSCTMSTFFFLFSIYEALSLYYNSTTCLKCQSKLYVFRQ